MTRVPHEIPREPSPDSWATGLESRRDWVPWIVFLLGLLSLFPSIGSETSVTGSDEYTLSLRTPMEMQERGDWLTPWVNGEPRLRKPPLLYWLTLVNYQLFGVHLIAARIWGVIAGAGLALGACLLSRELHRSTGLLAGLFTLGCLGVAAQGRQAMLDLPLATLVSFALWFLVRWVRTQRLPDALAAAGSLGLSFLMKGPVGLFFFAAGVVAAAITLPLGPALRRHPFHWLIAMGVLAGVVVPWPLAMHRIWGDRFVSILGEELAARGFGSWHGRSPLSALGGALGLIAPWTPAVIGAVVHWGRTPADGRRPEDRWLVLAFLLSVVPFFFMRAFERYMLAVVPIQAVMAAGWLAAGGPWRVAALRLSAGVIAVLTMFVGLGSLWFRLGWVAPAAVLMGSIWLLLEAFRHARPVRVALLVVALLTLCLGALYPRLGLNHLPRDIETTIGGRPVYAFERNLPAMLSPRLGRSIQRWTPETRPPQTPFLVFVEADLADGFAGAVRTTGGAFREVTRFRTLYSRKAWVRFARPGTTAADWIEAFRARSLDGLRTEFLVLEVSAPATPMP
ncbi:MAG: glycosyltransferase family 39 protein [Verrucomicrobiae bacterium]|nr:glycosyltransferase family 39 protein [Verrucomicrobiae bacterium]